MCDVFFDEIRSVLNDFNEEGHIYHIYENGNDGKGLNYIFYTKDSGLLSVADGEISKANYDVIPSKNIAELLASEIQRALEKVGSVFNSKFYKINEIRFSGDCSNSDSGLRRKSNVYCLILS